MRFVGQIENRGQNPLENLLDNSDICWTNRTNTKFVGQVEHRGQIYTQGHGGKRAVTHAGEREAGRQTGEHADRLAGRHARTHAGGQAGGLAPADLLLNTGTPGGTHTANLRPRRIVPG